MALNEMFPVPPESAIASYTFNEFASGQGIQIFYLGDIRLTGGTVDTKEYALFTEAFPPATGTYVPTGAVDLDFDVTIRKPIIIGGTALVSLRSSYVNGGAQTDVTYTSYIRKYSGGVETDIVSGAVILRHLVGTTAQKDVVHKLTVPTTKFKAGDILRYTITTSANTGGGFGIDPTNTVDLPQIAGGKSMSLLYIPVKIDL